MAISYGVVLALKYRLGIPLYGSECECPACHLPSDQMGDHALSCAQYGDRIARHNLLRDILFETAASAALAPAREVRHLLPGREARPADILLPRWSNGKDAALDVTVTSSLASSHVAGAAASAGAALRKPTQGKCRELQKPVGNRALPLCPSPWKPWGACTR